MNKIKIIFAILFSLVLLAPTLPVLGEMDQNKPVIHFLWSVTILSLIASILLFLLGFYYFFGLL